MKFTTGIWYNEPPQTIGQGKVCFLREYRGTKGKETASGR